MRTKILLLAVAVLFLSGCAAVDKAKEEQKKTEKEGYLPQQVGLYQGMKEDIQKATDAENKKTNDALEESGLNNKQNNMELANQYSSAILKTNLGDIKVKFYGADSPATVNNFLKLAQTKFYDGTKFHRVIPGFMIQGGDPNSKDNDWSNDGQGGPGYSFKDELTGSEKYPQGTLAMANSGPNTNGSQFFIVTASPAAQLPPSYTVFGQVTSGMDVALKIEKVERNGNDHPLKDVVIQGIELVK